MNYATTLLPVPPPVSTPATSSGAGGPATASATIAAALARLAPGSEIAGAVVQRDTVGRAVLRTELGDLALSARLALAVGTRVVLRLEDQGGPATGGHSLD